MVQVKAELFFPGGIFRRRLRPHRTCRRCRICTSVSAIASTANIKGSSTYASAREAGRPMTGRVVNERSSNGISSGSSVRSLWKNILRKKAPLSPRPNTSREKPTRKWLSFPMVGTNGLPDAACQTSWSAESMCERSATGARRRGRIEVPGFAEECSFRFSVSLGSCFVFGTTKQGGHKTTITEFVR